jgi:hypothetical protein
MQKQRGLAIAIHTSRAVVDRFKDTKLAVAITNAYILPNVEVGDERSWVWLSRENVIERAITVYRDAKDNQRLIAAYELLLKYASNKNVADSARFQLARLHLQNGDKEKASQYAKEMDAQGGMSGGKKTLSGLLEEKPDEKSDDKKRREREQLLRRFLGR